MTDEPKNEKPNLRLFPDPPKRAYRPGYQPNKWSEMLALAGSGILPEQALASAICDYSGVAMSTETMMSMLWSHGLKVTYLDKSPE